MKKFKIGDRVRIVKKVDTHGWISPTMDNMINDGKIYTIANDAGSFYSLAGEHYGFPEEAMEFANIKEVKVDIQLEKHGDCYQALLDGYILRSGMGMWAKLVDGVQQNDTGCTPYCFDRPEQWGVFEEVETDWFDNIPVCGILCWVADSESSFYKREIDLITGYDPNRKTRKFHGTSGCSWQCAKPISKEELESLSFRSV